MKVLLTGAAGQLGQALINSTPAGVELLASSRSIVRQKFLPTGPYTQLVRSSLA